MKAQRLRIRYRLTPEALGMKHRDIVDAWAEALTAAGLDLCRSEGKRPSALISLGAPLPQGVTSDCEYLDVYLATPADLPPVAASLRGRLPPGLEAVSAEEVGPGSPSLQSLVRWAEYDAWVPAAELSREDLQAAVDGFLQDRVCIFERRKETKVKRYDIRPLVLAVSADEPAEGAHHLRLRLRAEQDSAARADDVIAALGLPAPLKVHRRALYLEEVPAVIAAHRRDSGQGGGR
jgi:radical SAM-linked protein